MIVHKHLNELLVAIVTVDCLIELIVINKIAQGTLIRDLHDVCLILLNQVLILNLTDRVRGKLDAARVDLPWVLFLCHQVLVKILVLVLVFLLVFVLLLLNILFIFVLLYLLLHDDHSWRLHLIIVLVSIELIITIIIISERRYFLEVVIVILLHTIFIFNK